MLRRTDAVWGAGVGCGDARVNAPPACTTTTPFGLACAVCAACAVRRCCGGVAVHHKVLDRAVHVINAAAGRLVVGRVGNAATSHRSQRRARCDGRRRHRRHLLPATKGTWRVARFTAGLMARVGGRAWPRPPGKGPQLGGSLSFDLTKHAHACDRPSSRVNQTYVRRWRGRGSRVTAGLPCVLIVDIDLLPIAHKVHQDQDGRNTWLPRWASAVWGPHPEDGGLHEPRTSRFEYWLWPASELWVRCGEHAQP